MYTQVVDELLDLQLEFEEKLADAEEQTQVDLAALRTDLEERAKVNLEEVATDLEKHKAAIAKLSEKLQKTQDALTKSRSAGNTAPGSAPASSPDLEKL